MHGKEEEEKKNVRNVINKDGSEEEMKVKETDIKPIG